MNTLFTLFKRELEEIGIKTEHYDGLFIANGKNPTNGILSAILTDTGIICTGPNEFQFCSIFGKKSLWFKRKLSIWTNFSTNLKKRYINQSVHAYYLEPYSSGGYLGLGKIKCFLKRR